MDVDSDINTLKLSTNQELQFSDSVCTMDTDDDMDIDMLNMELPVNQEV